MANALDAVLQLRNQEQADRQAEFGSLANALNIFGQARQQVVQNQFEQLKMKAGLAEKGLRLDQSGNIIRDPSLQDPVESLLKIGKIGEAAKNLNLPGLYQNAQQAAGGVAGEQPVQAQPQDNSLGLPPELMSAANERDAFGEKTLKAQLAEDQLKQINKGVSDAEAGRVTLAGEAVKSIEDVKKLLFPKGTADSFNRELALGSNLPRILGIGPKVRPDNPLDPTDNKKSQEAQSVFRKLGTALSGRQLIQTGVAARPEETMKLIEQFAPSFTSNPEAAMEALDQLSSFYKDYLNKTDPKKKFNASKQSERVTVISPEGKIGTIPASQLDEAVKNGYKRK